MRAGERSLQTYFLEGKKTRSIVPKMRRKKKRESQKNSAILGLVFLHNAATESLFFLVFSRTSRKRPRALECWRRTQLLHLLPPKHLLPADLQSLLFPSLGTPQLSGLLCLLLSLFPMVFWTV